MAYVSNFQDNVAGLYPRHGPGHPGSDLAIFSEPGDGQGFDPWEMEMECMEDRKIPSGNLLHSYWKWSFILDLPIEHGDFP